MAVYEVFAEDITYIYKSTVCSKATLFLVITSACTLFFPLLVAYRSQGFWVKSASLQEQPDVHFKHEYLLVVETDKLDSPVLCSTFPLLNDLINDKNRHYCSLFKSTESDYNKDGKYDALHIESETKLGNTDSVHSVKLLLVFDYKLYAISLLHLEGLAVVQESFSLPGARLDVVADLRLIQKQMLHSHGKDLRFNTPIFDFTSQFPESFSLPSLLRNYARRNFSTQLANMYSTWTAGRLGGATFRVTVTILYPEETIIYQPSFWQIIKWAWIQYLSLLLVAVYLFRILKTYAFQNQLVPTVKNIPWKSHLH